MSLVETVESDRLQVLRLAHRIARRETPRLKARHGANLLGVGVGLRRREGIAEPELVLRVYVRQKRRDVKGVKGGRIAESFRGFIQKGSRRVSVTLRTDVHEMRPGQPHGMSGKVRVTKEQGGAERGSLSCLVRRGDSPDLYALSCKHVFAARPHGDGTGAVPKQIDLDGVSDVFEMRNPLTDSTEWDLSCRQWSCDAAIAFVKDATRVSSLLQGQLATSAPIDQDDYEAISPGMTLKLLTGTGIKRVRVSDLPPLDLVLGGFKTAATDDASLRFRRLIAYEGVTPADDPEGGDSGSAVLYDANDDGRGLLVGVHFWGDGEMGYAQFIGDVFREESFQSPLQLVSDHNV